MADSVWQVRLAVALLTVGTNVHSVPTGCDTTHQCLETIFKFVNDAKTHLAAFPMAVNLEMCDVNAYRVHSGDIAQVATNLVLWAKRAGDRLDLMQRKYMWPAGRLDWIKQMVTRFDSVKGAAVQLLSRVSCLPSSQPSCQEKVTKLGSTQSRNRPLVGLKELGNEPFLRHRAENFVLHLYCHARTLKVMQL